MTTTTLEEPGDFLSDYNAQLFMIMSVLSKCATATLVQVVAVTNAGSVTPVGMVDVQPLINMMDGAGVPIPHSIVHNCPYFRLQGGQNAVILDPQVGDIGIAVFADRDASSVIAVKAQANPGSRRMFSMSDGLYIGGVLNGVPNQYVQFNTSGITILSPNAVTITAPNVTVNASTAATVNTATATVSASSATNITTPTMTLNGNLVVNGTSALNGAISGGGTGGAAANFTGAINATGNIKAGSIDLETHVHTGVQAGGSNTGGPTG